MAIITSPLSTTEVHKAKPAAKPYYLFDGRGLCLQINPPQGQCSDWRAIFPARDFPALSVFHSAGDNPALPGKDVH
ncbi:TPA: hypothetical protein N3A35_001479 [Salmonella enterica subsp. salamae serovar 16:m,t:e,n,x]|nr:hypothetical protein [Salmonella enterica subsp. salamae serovar 16:m,t:e,n,x]